MNFLPKYCRRIAETSAALCLILSAGCVYQLGTSLPPNMRSIHVPLFSNRSGEPLVETEVTHGIISEIQRNGNLKIASADTADIILEGALTAFAIEPIQYERDAPKRAREYRLRLAADITVRKRSGETILTRSVKGENTFMLLGDLTSAKRAAFPKAAADLAHNVVECIIEYW